MPKFPSIPRVSIVVPIGSNLAAFESTLISVLEKQPAGCEVLVAHDGSYDDPFQLCDEVRFVVSHTDSIADLVAAAASVARGRFVHVLADGVCATSGWLDGALEKFEHFDAACVAPVIRHRKSKKIVSAGWHDGKDQLCKQACQGQIDPTAAPKLVGAHLQASFWRREVLRSLANAFATSESSTAISYAYEHLMRNAGWRTVLASECDVTVEEPRLSWCETNFARGQKLRAIRSCFSRQKGWGQSLAVAAGAVVSNILTPARLPEAVGQAFAPLAVHDVTRQLRLGEVCPCDDDKVIMSMPVREGQVRSRRAA